MPSNFLYVSNVILDTSSQSCPPPCVVTHYSHLCELCPLHYLQPTYACSIPVLSCFSPMQYGACSSYTVKHHAANILL